MSDATTSAAPVVITRDGNLLSITPAMPALLGPALTYTHREQIYEFGTARDVVVRDRALYRLQDNALITMQGALSRIEAKLRGAGVPYVIDDRRARTALEPDYQNLVRCMPNLEFRFKQDDILARLIAVNGGIIVAPTAFGKTFIMLALVALYPAATIIIASPSVALLNSTYRRLLPICPAAGRVGAGHNNPQRVTLSTFRSVLKAPTDRCDILLIDEVHRLAAPGTSATFALLRTPVKIFGMSATPIGRSDGADLVAEVMVGPVVYTVPYDDAAQAGIVAPIKAVMIPVDGVNDPRCVSTRYEMKVAKHRWCYWRNAGRNAAIAEAVRGMPGRMGIRSDPQILILVKTLEHALRMQHLLPDFELIYGSLDRERMRKLQSAGLLPADYKPLTARQRDRLLTTFEDGSLRKAIATSCWGEGVDFVHLDVLVNAAGESSPIGAIQWAGRTSRLHADKTFGLLLDCDDGWDNWAHGRATRRTAMYRKKGWEVIYHATRKP